MKDSNQIIDNKTQFGKKQLIICKQLSQGVNYLINQNLESRGCPNKFLDD